MSYIWDKFNIKTFPSETLVYLDGNYQPDFSTLEESEYIYNKYDLPIHIIYVGDIVRENTLNINLMASNQPVFLSANVKNNLPAFLNIFIKNAGKNSEIRGHIICQNSSDLSVKIVAEHDAPQSGILLQTKIIGMADSYSRISGTAIINPNCISSRSDIRLEGYALDKSAKLRLIPQQRILATPEFADHSAYMFHIKPDQENYLRSAGLSSGKINEIVKESFINNFNLF